MNTIVCIGSSGNTTQEDLCKRKEVITYIKSIVEYLEEVVKEITFRHTKIKNAIEWRRFLSGA
jgi:hypothetical protein